LKGITTNLFNNGDLNTLVSAMAGEPFKVGRFAHTLRVRLMREHLGIDVDSLSEENLMTRQPVKNYYEQEAWDPDNEQTYGQASGFTHRSKRKTALGNFTAEGVGNVNQG
jgi:phospholipase D1/2